MHLSEQKITAIQQALNTYGIAVPVTGQYCEATAKGYMDWSRIKAPIELQFAPNTDDQVNPALLALNVDAAVAAETKPLTKAELKAAAALEQQAAAEADALIKEANAAAALEQQEAEAADALIKEANAKLTPGTEA